MNLDKVKLIRESSREFVVRDEDGKEFVVSKNKLGGATIQGIRQHFASGGTVLSEDDDVPGETEIGGSGGVPVFTVDLDGDGKPDGEPVLAANLMPSHSAPSGTIPLMSSHQPGAGPGPVQMMSSHGPGTASDAPAFDFSTQQTRGTPGSASLADPNTVQGVDQPGSSLSMMPSNSQDLGMPSPQMAPAHAPVTNQQAVANVQRGMSQPQPGVAPKTPRTGGGVPGAARPMDEIGSNLKMAEDSINQQNQIRTDFAEKSAMIDQQREDAMKQIVADRQRTSEEHAKRGEDLFNAYMNKTIDPQRLWKNASTSNKLAASFAMAMGAYAQGMSGGAVPNTVAQMADKAIDRDIEAQKMDLQKGEFALNYHLKKGEVMEHAFDLAKADALDVAAAQYKTLLSHTTGQMAQAQGGMQIAEMRNQAMQLRQNVETHKMDMALKQTNLQFGKMKNAEMALAFNKQKALDAALQGGGPLPGAMASQLPPNYFMDKNGGLHAAQDKDQADAMREKTAHYSEIESIYNQIKQKRDASRGLTGNGGAAMPFGPENAELKDLGDQLRLRLLKYYQAGDKGGAGRSGQLQQKVDKMVPDPQAFWTMGEATFNARIDSLMHNVDNDYRSNLGARVGSDYQVGPTSVNERAKARENKSKVRR